MSVQEHADPRWFRTVQVTPIEVTRIRAARAAFTCRRVPLVDPRYDWNGLALISGPVRPRSGDIVLAEVTRLGHHRRIELRNGRRPYMREGDEIIVAYGDRYAPDQFESNIPLDLRLTNLSAGGGVAATVINRHSSTRRPTEIQPVGLLGRRNGTPLNLADFALPVILPPSNRPPVIAVFGTSMNAGKTTAVASLIEGLVAAGQSPGGTKVTGTGSGGDYWSMVDAGARTVLDFTDAGYASTYRLPIVVVEKIMAQLIDHLASAGCSSIVVEVADGIFQQETAALLRSPIFKQYVDGVIFAAGDAVGAVGGSEALHRSGIPLLALSGACTASPLAIREIAQNSPVPVLTKPELSSAKAAEQLLRWAIENRWLKDNKPDVTATSRPAAVAQP
ncbi:MAG: DUF1611 domain-containing protein [Acidimicrobiia bacterium]|nr:DUF1611 domain-containing protein [Acidimicrobiia bacterium]